MNPDCPAVFCLCVAIFESSMRRDLDKHISQHESILISYQAQSAKNSQVLQVLEIFEI